MMSDLLRVDPVRLREAARFAADKAQAMRDRLGQLDDTIGKRLLAEGWDGTAAVKYDGSWTEWKQGAEAIIGALDESATKLVEAANLYEAQEQSNTAAVGQVRLNMDS
ncbi:WXG100 family type VII secretion target [Nocardia wallacei]|uniref:WXG100 family type VII secretion target n=1 Tax=Nocardia wallacei TaxID=480035 RepID=UPI0024546089|nr:WXG100 family type VII secretion target [Nocardia wallacei]